MFGLNEFQLYLLLGGGILFALEFGVGLWAYRRAQYREEMWHTTYGQIMQAETRSTGKGSFTRLTYEFISGGELRRGIGAVPRAAKHFPIGGPIQVLFDPSDFSKFILAEQNKKSVGLVIIGFAIFQAVLWSALVLSELKHVYWTGT
jgi:hypothetical protein